MADPKTTFVVSIFDTAAKMWRNILTTTSRDEAEAMLAKIGDKGRVEVFPPQTKRKR